MTYGGAGDDFIESFSGSNANYGGDGNDFIETFGGSQTVYAGNGNDVVRASTGGTVYAGAGDDVIKTSSGDCELHGGEGNDVILASGNSPNILLNYFDKGTINGDSGDDVIEVAGGSREISGGTGDDLINVWGGEQTIRGDAGNDVINLTESKAEIHFTSGNGADTISGADADDSIIFSGGLSREDAQFELKDGNLMIGFKGADDQVTLKNWNADTSPGIIFSDGNQISHVSAAGIGVNAQLTYPAMPLARQQEHYWLFHSSPLEPGTDLLARFVICQRTNLS